MNVYDFDNTIYDGDSTADFYFFILHRHKKALKELPSLTHAFCRYYILKKGTKTQFKEIMYRFLQYANMKDDLTDFWDTHIKNIKPWYVAQQKTDDLIISASPEFLLKPACQRLAIKHLIASRVDKNTGKYDGLNCHGEEKVKRMYEEFPEIIVDKFYSDSYSDTPLAKTAKQSFIVKGNKLKRWNFDKADI